MMNIRKQFKEDIQGIIAQNSHLSKTQLTELINQSFNSDNVYLRIWAEKKNKALNSWMLSKQKNIVQSSLNFDENDDPFLSWLDKHMNEHAAIEKRRFAEEVLSGSTNYVDNQEK